MFDWLADPNAWIALATLTALEIVLGIDNIIFISILVGEAACRRRSATARAGFSVWPLAMVMRILLLLSINVDHAGLTEPIFSDHRPGDVSGSAT